MGTSPPQPEGEGLSRAELKRAALSGVRWTTFARVGGQLVTLGSAVVLAHLIPPAEFGRAALALVITRIATVLLAQGFGAPLVQRKSFRPAHAQTALLMGVVAGVALALLSAFALAPLLGATVGSRAADLLRLSSLAFVAGSLAVVPTALLQRQLDFKRLSTVDLVSQAVAASAGVALAVGGLDGEAIVLMGVAQISAAAALSIAFVWPLPRPGWERAAMRDIVGFGSPATGSTLLASAFNNLDYAIIGIKLAPAQVGFYYRAYTLGVSYQRKFTMIMTQLAFPLYSRTKDKRDMALLRTRIMRMNAVLVFPALATLAGTAPELVPWLFGERWEPAVVPAQILAVGGMVTAVLSGTGPLLMAAGKPGAVLKFNAWNLTVLAAVLLLCTPHGLIVTCVGVVGAYLHSFVIASIFLYGRVLGIPPRTLLAEIAPGVALAVAAAVSFPLTWLLSDLGLPAPVTVAVVGLVVGALALAMLRWLFTAVWRDLRTLVLGAFGRRRSREAAAGGLPGPPGGGADAAASTLVGA